VKLKQESVVQFYNHEKMVSVFLSLCNNCQNIKQKIEQRKIIFV